MGKYEDYRDAKIALPETYKAWQVFGAGFENLGKDGKTSELSMRGPEANEVLLRIDVLGLCLSDIKIIKQGGAHPRLRGRDLSNDPTVLGHEAAVTIMAVGEQWKDRFHAGERYIVQADIYYKGLGYAFGYLIPGGMQQYAFVDERVLDGDEGCYLLPVKDATGYSQSALAEPWACVEMSYNLEDRLAPAGGAMLVVGDIAGDLKSKYPDAKNLASDLDGLTCCEKFDDIVVVNPAIDVVNALADRLNKDGVMYLLGVVAEEGMVTLDVGRIHYENMRFYGGAPDMASLAKANERADLLPGGKSLFIGAGGPMGQMHVQRAVELPNGSKTVVVTDLDKSRLEHIKLRFGAMAEAKGVEFHLLAPSDFESPDAMDARIRELGAGGYDDVCVLAPVPALVTQAMGYAGVNAIVNVFAGIPIDNAAQIPFEALCRGVKIIGSSGSRITDLRRILELVEREELNTDMSVAAIGGLNAAKEGIAAVRDAKYPGKTVIYTQIEDLPLIPLEDVPEKLPELKDKLGPQGVWSKEAEQVLLEKYL